MRTWPQGSCLPHHAHQSRRHQNAVDFFEIWRRVFAFKDFSFDPVEIDLDLVGNATVLQRFDQRLISILQLGIFTDNGNGNFAFRVVQKMGNTFPAFHTWLRCRFDTKCCKHFVVETFLMIGNRHIINGRDVERLNNRTFTHITEQRQLAAFGSRISRSARTRRISGAIPIERSSLTECCVGLVLSSPAAGIYGINVRWI